MTEAIKKCWKDNLVFHLSDDDMKNKIAGFGDGPASINFEATKQGYSVTSFDPIYCFSKRDIQRRMDEVRVSVNVKIVSTEYEFQKGDNKMLIIR